MNGCVRKNVQVQSVIGNERMGQVSAAGFQAKLQTTACDFQTNPGECFAWHLRPGAAVKNGTGTRLRKLLTFCRWSRRERRRFEWWPRERREERWGRVPSIHALDVRAKASALHLPCNHYLPINYQYTTLSWEIVQWNLGWSSSCFPFYSASSRDYDRDRGC